MFVRSKGEKDDRLIKEVDFKLHPSYVNPHANVCKAPFEHKRRARYTFVVPVTIMFKQSVDQKPLSVAHLIDFCTECGENQEF